LADISKINAVLLANIAEIDDVLAANIAKVNGLVFSTAPAFTGLLDTYTGAAAAYSTRRLYGQYTGAALRVREDSGDTETDIGFDSNGDLDTAAIATHCGSANGYVTKWYGQESSGGTGSGNDAEQSTSGTQPQIYNGTAVITENGKPCIKFVPINRLQTTASLTLYNVIAVCTSEETSYTYGNFVAFENAVNDTGLSVGTSNTQIYGPQFSGDTLTDIDVYQDAVLFGHGDTDYADTENQHLYYAITTSQKSAGKLALGDRIDNNGGPIYGPLACNIQEVIVYPTNQSSTNRSGIEGNQNAHYQIGNFGTPTSGLLYDYSGAAAAYSVRQLSNTSALAMRIREDGTDTETDIGFDANGNLDTAAIASHCGANNGYVVSWADQSGNQVDATQSTTTAQPQIYNGTAVITENGKPALQYDGTDDSLEVSVSFSHAGHTYTVGSGENNGLEFGLCMGGSSGERFETVFDQRSSPKRHTVVVDTSTNYVDLDSQATVGQQYLLSNSNDSGTIRGYVDGVEQSSTITGYSALSINVIRLARFPGGGGLAYGEVNLQEAIIFNAAGHSNRTGIESNINSEYLIYQPTDAPTSGLLATYTGAAAAYSVRQLSDKAVIAMRIRRDSDDAETNIGFDANGDLDTTAISDFCSTANGYVVEWADQSTNGNHATQATNADQMQIYNGSAVITENGKPALQHGTVNGGLDITGFTGGTDATVLAVMADIVNNAIPIISLASGVPYAFRTVASGADSAYRGFGTSPNSFVNGVEDTDLQQGEMYTAFNSAQGLVIGIGSTSGWTGSTFHFGWQTGQLFQEVIFWNSDQDTAGNITGIQNNVNNYFSIY